MRPGQNRRMRGRNRNNKGPNPLTRSYESNGPDVKIRGTAQHIAEKYSQLARDAQSSGDPVAAENYLQHAEHYFRIIAAAQEQLREQYGYQRSFDEDGEEEGGFAPGERGYANGEDGDFGQQPQPFEARPFENRQDNRGDNRGDGRGDDERGDRQDRGERPQRFDRQDRGDRPNRFNRDRQDRGQDNRQDNRPDRGPRQDYRQDNRQETRPDRGDRPDFRAERQDRPDRGERPDNRQDNRGEGRQEFQRDDRPERSDRPERAPRQDRAERNGRDFRRERREEPAAEETGLPAFLTNPVRAPVAIESDAPEAAAEAAINGAPAAEGGEYPRRRRRRTTRGLDAETPDFVPEVETPPAE